ncbi:MAG: acyl-CoA thioesterase [Treponema sp.]|nr:acyl-CoA thioesterase [Treponema sp.]
MKYTSELTVRSYECDSYGHVNNAVYLNFLEYGRMEYLHQIGFDYQGLIAAGYYLYIAHIDIYYKASAVLDDRLFIDVEAVQTKAVSGTFHQTVRKADGTICAEADVTWASVTHDGRPARIPDAYRVPELFPETAASAEKR